MHFGTHGWCLNLPCRSFSEVVQTRFVSCQSVQKFLTCWKNYAFGKLFSDFSPNVATNPSASYVVLEEMLILLILQCVCVSIYHYFTKVQCRDAWDMAAEICLSQLPSMVEDPNSEFQVFHWFSWYYVTLKCNEIAFGIIIICFWKATIFFILLFNVITCCPSKV